MADKSNQESTLTTRAGIPPPPNVNPRFSGHNGRNKRRQYSVDEYVSGICEGNITILSQAITLVESSLPGHYEAAQEIIERCLPSGVPSIRIGVTGVPGVGKSRFIESFGLHLVGAGRKTAVLAIDPSSDQTRGSILGDKSRMEKLSNHPGAFIRPSPSAGTLGGVARKTRESIILCEAAGFDTIIVETVGVGQSETAVHTMVDFFLLLMLAGAGDDLQGIKRGIMEIADAIAITKADGANRINAEGAKVTYQNAINLFPPQPSGWKPRVVTCSAREVTGIGEIWDMITEYIEFNKRSGYFGEARRNQSILRMHDSICEYLNASFYADEAVKKALPEIETDLAEGRITSYKAALKLLDYYFRK